MLIPLWRQANDSHRRARLRLLEPTISYKYPATGGSVGVALRSTAVSVRLPKQAIDDRFTCPITGLSLPECACTKSSLKLHDACVFCPAAGLHS